MKGPQLKSRPIDGVLPTASKMSGQSQASAGPSNTTRKVTLWPQCAQGALWFLQVIWNVDMNSEIDNKWISPFFQEQML